MLSAPGRYRAPVDGGYRSQQEEVEPGVQQVDPDFGQGAQNCLGWRRPVEVPGCQRQIEDETQQKETAVTMARCIEEKPEERDEEVELQDDDYEIQVVEAAVREIVPPPGRPGWCSTSLSLLSDLRRHLS